MIVPNPRKPAPPRPQAADEHKKGVAIKLALAFVAIYVIWGSTYLAIRYAVETIPPLVTVGVRQAVAGGIMLAWAWARGFRPTRQQWVAGFALGTFFFLIGHGSLFWAEQYVGSGLAALLIATEPMFILVLGWMMSQQKISRMSALGLAVGVAGVANVDGSGAVGEGFEPAGSVGSAAGVFGVVRGGGDFAASETALGRDRTNCATDHLRRGHVADRGGSYGRVSTNPLGEHFFEVVGGAGISHHLWVGGGVHFLCLAAATGSARVGGDAYLCESGSRGFAGVVSGPRAAIDASGAGDSGDSRSHRADPAGRESGGDQACGHNSAGNCNKDRAGMRLNACRKMSAVHRPIAKRYSGVESYFTARRNLPEVASTRPMPLESLWEVPYMTDHTSSLFFASQSRA